LSTSLSALNIINSLQQWIRARICQSTLPSPVFAMPRTFLRVTVVKNVQIAKLALAKRWKIDTFSTCWGTLPFLTT
jgi:hypothetical protein